MRRKFILSGLTALLLFVCLFPRAGEFPGKADDWNGYQRHTFTYDGRQCFVVEPKKPVAGKPWVWRARFFGHRPEVDLALLDKGFHIAYMDVAEMLGNTQAVAHWNKFHQLLTSQYGFANKAALEGLARGAAKGSARSARVANAGLGLRV